MTDINLANESQVGRITESRLGRPLHQPDGPLARWGAKPSIPVNGKWLSAYRCNSSRLSNGLGTDRKWYAFDFTACLIKGFCRWDVIDDALAEHEHEHRPIGLSTSTKTLPIRCFFKCGKRAISEECH